MSNCSLPWPQYYNVTNGDERYNKRACDLIRDYSAMWSMLKDVYSSAESAMEGEAGCLPECESFDFKWVED